MQLAVHPCSQQKTNITVCSMEVYFLMSKVGNDEKQCRKQGKSNDVVPQPVDFIPQLSQLVQLIKCAVGIADVITAPPALLKEHNLQVINCYSNLIKTFKVSDVLVRRLANSQHQLLMVKTDNQSNNIGFLCLNFIQPNHNYTHTPHEP